MDNTRIKQNNNKAEKDKTTNIKIYKFSYDPNILKKRKKIVHIDRKSITRDIVRVIDRLRNTH